jgi:hypothetical protein
VSFALDANVLLYASDTSSPFHPRALEFLRECMNGPELVFVPWPVVLAYLRVATHPAVFRQPLSQPEANGNIEALLRRPHVRTLGEADGFWNFYQRASRGVVVRGNLVHDAHLVALLLQHGVATLWTHDRDFQKFDGIRVRDPFAES